MWRHLNSFWNHPLPLCLPLPLPPWQTPLWSRLRSAAVFIWGWRHDTTAGNQILHTPPQTHSHTPACCALINSFKDLQPSLELCTRMYYTRFVCVNWFFSVEQLKARVQEFTSNLKALHLFHWDWPDFYWQPLWRTEPGRPSPSSSPVGCLRRSPTWCSPASPASTAALHRSGRTSPTQSRTLRWNLLIL